MRLSVAYFIAISLRPSLIHLQTSVSIQYFHATKKSLLGCWVQLLATEMENGIHALSLKTQTPAEAETS